MKNYIIPILPLLGVVVAWSLGVLTNQFKNRSEEKQRLRTVLYILIEFRHVYSKGDLLKFLKCYQGVLRDKLPEEQLAHYNEGGQHYSTMFSMLKKQVAEKVKSMDVMEEKFEASVLTLAAYEPWLAYRISGKPAVLREIFSLEKLLASINSGEELTEEQLILVETQLKQPTVKKLLSELENDISQLSKIIGRKEHKRTKAFLNEDQESSFGEESLEFVGSLVQNQILVK